MLKGFIDRFINRFRSRKHRPPLRDIPYEPPMKCGYWMFRDSIKPGGYFTTDTDKNNQTPA